MSKKYDIDYVKELVKDISGYTLLEDKYVNNRTKMTGIDDNGYKYYFTLDSIKRLKCSRFVDTSNPYSIDNIKLWLINNNLKFKLLSTEYLGNGSKNRDKYLLKLMCENGHILYRTWNDICSGVIRCEECRMRFKNHDEFIHYTKSIYADEYEILGTYTNSSSKIKIKHNTCGTIFEIRAEHFANGHGCPTSKCCKKHGNEHYRYNCNITDEERYSTRDLSSEYRNWRKSVYDKYSYTCDICHKKAANDVNIVAHHLDSWDNNIDKRYDISNGVVLCETCHKAFHGKYGYGNNSVYQYQEFKNNHDNIEVRRQIA